MGYVFTHAYLTVYWLNKVNSKVWQMNDHDISIADQEIINHINLMDSDELGQEMLSVIGKNHSIFLDERTGSVIWADIDEHPIANAPKAIWF